MDTARDVLLSAIHVTERGRGRNQQVRIGPSSLGGCSRKVWLQITEAPAQQGTRSMAAWMGTAIHASITDGLRLLDPFGDRFLIEVPLERDGMPGTADCFDRETGRLIDWKSTTKKSLGWLVKEPPTLGASAANWPYHDQKWQAQTYGWMLTGMGYEVKTVCLVGIPRDGDERFIRVWEEPYEEAAALEAQAWLADIRGSSTAPGPEKHPGFCRSYCEFYTADGSVCAGKE